MAEKHEYTPGEKRMIVSCYEYFQKMKAQKVFQGTRTRELVAECLNCASSTVDRVLNERKRNPNTNFTVALRPTTATRISIHLNEETGILLSERTMQRVLGELDFRYVKGENRHIYADSAANVAFRNEYLREKVANRVGDALCLPEVYLDEPFSNANHVRDRTWLSSDNIRYNKSGKGDRWYHCKSWPYNELCINLDTNYGPCIIHMDGAGYHKRMTNEMPTSKSLRQWLENYLSKIANLVYNRAANRKVLYSLAKLNKPAPEYAANTIATEYYHTLYYTPPYHPTLQPIELIWGLVKNRIASDPPKSGADAVEKVLAGLTEVKPAEWLARFRHVQKIEDEYLALQQDLES
ncbi:Hypothetical protein PHPALM_17527 [Phytophthora palmivora]|uniref:Winged helix-turn helix domain-containing protein n=1 Tax=Phytophthora palmivora TaxID=4796 RepID=A0A2P4XM62_9STRA|nr:Hypothetical protein PHPALM_17527 [Phytophthora palmivora]